MKVVVRRAGNATILRVAGEVDRSTVAPLATTLAARMAVVSGDVVIDLQSVTFIDCGGSTALTEMVGKASASGRKARLVPDGAAVGAEPTVPDSGDDTADPVRAQAVGRGDAKTARGRRTDEYAHLAPLFAERARLPAQDPRHEGLRAGLIVGYLPVAQHVARKYHRSRGENLDDLEQVATLGLINAVDRFEPERGFDFLSFAIPTIKGEVQRYYRDRASTIRVPRSLKELQPLLYRAADEMSQEMGRAPTPRELAAHVEVDLDAVVEALQAAYETHISSLDAPPRAEEDDSGEGRRLADTVGGTDLDLELVEYRESLEPLLESLPKRERDIVLLRFYGNMTQTQIAERIGISQMHVSRLLASTLAELRRQLMHG